MSERLGCSKAKREVESSRMPTISSSVGKVSEGSSTLVGESEGVRVVSQGSP